MGDKSTEKVVEMKPNKLSILDMLDRPKPRLERAAATPVPRPVESPAPPASPAEVPGNATEPPDTGGLEKDLPEILDPLPNAGDRYLQAYARASNKPLLTVSFLMKDGITARGFSYSTYECIDRLPSPKAGDGPAIVVRFDGHVTVDVRIEGRNLSKLYGLISEHRTAWVRELAGDDPLGDTDTVVTGIKVIPVA